MSNAPYRRPASLEQSIKEEELPGGLDPAVLSELAHTTAGALLQRAHQTVPDDPAVLERLLNLVSHDGLETVAQLWSNSPGDSLPGALWRLYVLREWVQRDPKTAAERYQLGVKRAEVASVIAGAPPIPTPDEIRQLLDEVLSGFFTGDLSLALQRAAAFCQVMVVGIALNADLENDELMASQATFRAENLRRTGTDLLTAAELWRDGKLY